MTESFWVGENLQPEVEDLQISVISLPAGMARYNLVLDYMSLRSDVFIGKKKWQLSSGDGIEWEQYDVHGASVYVLAHDGTTVHAGCRLMRADTIIGTGKVQYSYMIRDAYLGRISLPPEICTNEPPNDNNHWELTRMVSRGANRNASLRCMYGAYAYLAALNAKGCLCLGSPAVMRLAKVSGFRPAALGPVCGNKDGRFVAFYMPLVARNPSETIH